MKEHLIWYPVFSIIPWAINYILARFSLVETLIPLRFWIVGAFSIAWIKYLASNPSSERYWPVYLLFIFGMPYFLFWFVTYFPGEYEHENDDEENDLSFKDYAIGIIFLLIVFFGFGSWLIRNL